MKTVANSYKPEFIADGSGKWCTNQLRFSTYKEAERYAEDLAQRWTLVVAYRATACNDPANYLYTSNGELVDITTLEREPYNPRCNG